MAKYVAIQRSIHKDAGYKPTTNFNFAAHMQTVPLVLSEVANATQHMALAFQTVQAGTKHERFELVGIQSIIPNKNLFLTPDGRWLTGYRPAFYRSHPFALMSNPESKQVELSIDADHIVETPTDDNSLLFDNEGNLTEQLRDAVEFLSNTLQSRSKTLALCKELQDANLITPWAIKFTGKDNQDEPQIRTLQGLSHINSKALKELDSNTLAKLNQSGALEMAYAQILSEPRVSGLTTLANVHGQMEAQKAKQKASAEVDLDQLFDKEDELFSF